MGETHKLPLASSACLAQAADSLTAPACRATNDANDAATDEAIGSPRLCVSRSQS